MQSSATSSARTPVRPRRAEAGPSCCPGAEKPGRATPLTQDDLSAAELAKAAASGDRRAVAKAVHRAACALERDAYIDPETGLNVFTSHYLSQYDCCGHRCRHCPHGHRNVPSNGGGGSGGSVNLLPNWLQW